MQVDYIIIGQGICGTLLSWELMREGNKVLVVDNSQNNSSSRTACGLINPVTGMRHVKSWRFDELMETAVNSYGALGQDLGLQLLKENLLLHFFEEEEEETVFEDRVRQGSEHLYFLEDAAVWQNYFLFQGKVGVIHPCYMLSLPVFMAAYRKQLQNNALLLEEDFDWKELKLENKKAQYKGISADKVICCEGVGARINTYFDFLPFSFNKGEAILVSIPDLPRNHLYMNGIKIAPWKDGLYWIGSTFDWKYDNINPTKEFRANVERKLKNWLQLPFEIVDHIAAERPSSTDYHPFLGLHPQHPELAVFNGQGTKGCSQTPFFAKQMKEYLLFNKPLDMEVNIQRIFNKKR